MRGLPAYRYVYYISTVLPQHLLHLWTGWTCEGKEAMCPKHQDLYGKETKREPRGAHSMKRWWNDFLFFFFVCYLFTFLGFRFCFKFCFGQEEKSKIKMCGVNPFFLPISWGLLSFKLCCLFDTKNKYINATCEFIQGCCICMFLRLRTWYWISNQGTHV